MCAPRVRHRSWRSGGPSPRSVRIASSTSSAFPTARPSGSSIALMTATVRRPAAPPIPTIASARGRAAAAVFMNAPLPALTSRTIASLPAAIFLLMTELAISGMLSTVAVLSRSA